MSFDAAKVLDRLLGGAVLRLLEPLRVAQDLFSQERPLRAVREIVAVKFWGIGNAALLLPVLAQLRERHPAARLTVVTLRGNEALFRAAADRVLTVRARPLPATLLDLLRVLATLRRPRVDLAIDFEQFVRTSQVLLWGSGARQVIAFDTAGQRRARLCHVPVPYDDRQHVALSYQDLARAAGVREREYVPGGLQVDAAEADRIDRWRAGRPLVVLHAGSGDNFPGRRWPTRRFGLLARRLHEERGALVVATGSRREAGITQEVVDASEGCVHDLAGRLDLDGLLALLSRATLLVSNDTGPVHLASALGVPVLGLYGPNSPHLYGPRSEGSESFYDAPPCSPCLTNFNYKTSRCRNPVCIQAIGLESVVAAALARIESAADRRGAIA